MKAHPLVIALALLLPAGCRDAAERQAAELGGLREDASAGIVAVEAFCTARDSAIAYVERGEAGAELVLEEVLRAPVVLDDYCEEFRYHEHGEEEGDSSAVGAPAAPPGDTAGQGRGG